MFGDGRIIYRHCRFTLKFCDLLSKGYRSDKSILRVAAFLHESGKAYEVSWKILKERHEKYNWLISKELISRFQISRERKNKLKKILLHKKNDNSIEAKILHEADIIAFFADRSSQKAFAAWAKKRKLPGEIERKLSKMKKLKLKNSNKIALLLWRKSLGFWKRKSFSQ